MPEVTTHPAAPGTMADLMLTGATIDIDGERDAQGARTLTLTLDALAGRIYVVVTDTVMSASLALCAAGAVVGQVEAGLVALNEDAILTALLAELGWRPGLPCPAEGHDDRAHPLGCGCDP